MGKKKKRQHPEIEELLQRPWCYYCERDFDDLKILIHHQKAKHFKCERCARRLNTAGGLRVHMEQVHKETLEAVDNAISGRESVDLEIFGTEGIPDSEVAAHNQRIIAEHAQKEADRRAASGGGNNPKKPKIDASKETDPEELKKRLEAHRKAMAAGSVTPLTPGQSLSPAPPGPNSPGQIQSPQYAQAISHGGFPQGPSVMSPSGFNQPGFPPQGAQASFPQGGFGQPPFQPPQAPSGFAHGSGGQPPFNGGFQAPPTGPGGFGGVPGFNGPPNAPQGFGQYQPPRGPSSSLPQQIPGLPPKPSVPGLPPRPAFANTSGPPAPGPAPGNFGRGAPPTGPAGWQPPQQFGPPGAFGVAPAQQQPYQSPFTQGPPQQQSGPPGYAALPTAQSPPPGISVQQNSFSAPPPGLAPGTTLPVPEPTAPPQAHLEAPTQDNKAPAVTKRETRLVYEDNDVSPEEKRAQLPQYAHAVQASA